MKGINKKDVYQGDNAIILSGELAIRSLERLSQRLQDVGHYGLLELFGGGIISGAMKRSKVDDVKAYMAKSRDCLVDFKTKLNVCKVSEALMIDLGEFIKFADYFVEHKIADWTVQSRISDAKTQVVIISRKLDTILAMIKDELS